MLIVSLVVAPYPVAGGGGSANEVVYRWVLADRLGSALTEVDVEGEILRQARFKPFGGLDHEVQLSSGSERRRLYAGHAEQEETGFFYMQARWMDPETGTFLSVDPVVPSAGDPQSFNAYAYARNNPINAIDPIGQAWYFADSYVSSDGMSVVTVYTNSAAAAGAIWLGPPSSISSSMGTSGLSSASMGDFGGVSAIGFSSIGDSQTASTTPQSAKEAAINGLNQTSAEDSSKNEYHGWLIRDKDGNASATEPKLLGRHGGPPGEPPDDAFGDYHNHTTEEDLSAGNAPDDYSNAESWARQRGSWTSFIRTPSGALKEMNFRTTSVGNFGARNVEPTFRSTPGVFEAYEPQGFD